MHESHWGLVESPFSGGLDPRRFHAGPSHDEALARLEFLAAEGRRCGLLCGPAGSGKSLLLAVLSQRLRRRGRLGVRLDVAGADARDVLWQLAGRLGLGPDPADGPFELWRNVQDWLTGLDPSQGPLIVLADQVEQATPDGGRLLERLLRCPAAEEGRLALIAAVRTDAVRSLPGELLEACDLRVELEPFDEFETADHVRRLCERAGATSPPFDDESLRIVHARTAGNPRRIRRLCELALIAAVADGLPQVDADVVRQVADEFGLGLRDAARTREAASR